MANWKALNLPDKGLAHHISDAMSILEEDGTLRFPDLRSANRLLVASDYSGEHAGCPYATFGFVIAAEDSLSRWDRCRTKVRHSILKDSREMAYKKLDGDALRTKALRPFLDAANRIDGLLLVLAVAPDASIMFDRDELQQLKTQLPRWKDGPLEKLLTIGHWLAMFVAGLSKNGQAIAWLTDDDAITATEGHLHETAAAMWQLVAAYTGTEVPEVQVGTVGRNGGPDKFIADLASIADLAAGAVAASLVPSAVKERADVPSKVQDIVGWLGQRDKRLARVVLKLERASEDRLQIVPMGFRTTVMSVT